MLLTLTGKAYRPRRLYVRGHSQWKGLFPYLEEIGIGVSIRRELPKTQKAYEDDLQRMREAHRAGMLKPTAEQTTVEAMFPAITQWVQGYGHVEIGDQEGFGLVVRALDYGGLVFEDDMPSMLTEAMVALENGLRKWLEKQGADLG
jgi:hypothetical protein